MPIKALNARTGVKSTRSLAFGSENGWGKVVRNYAKSAQSLNEHAWKIVLEEAKDFEKISRRHVFHDDELIDDTNSDGNMSDDSDIRGHLPLDLDNDLYDSNSDSNNNNNNNNNNNSNKK